MLRPFLSAFLLAGLSACQTTAPPTADADYAGQMRHQHDGDTPTASGAAAGADSLDVVSEAVRYATVGGRPVTGTLVRPRGAAPDLPGLVVVHEWWGLNDNIRQMAARYAAEGYAVLAVDLYGGRAAATPDEAMQIMESVDRAAAADNLRQAHAFLAGRGAPRVGVLGWCFGGVWSLRAALALPTEVDATVIYYGNPVTSPAALRPLQMPVLALFGGADDSIPADTIAAFDRALTEADVEHEVVVYPGAAHAFANPSGQRYDPAAAADAYARTTAFLAEHLK